MNHIKKYNFYTEDRKVNEIINYIELSINESRDLENIWNNTLSKVKNLSKEAKKKVLKYLLYSLIAFNTVVNIKQIINTSSADNETKSIATEILKDINKDTLKNDNYKKGYEFILSQEGWDHIRKEEGLKLKAYKIGDGMITVGYGHAEPIKRSKFKIGQRITKKIAESLLKSDIKKAADGVRRMFKDWEKRDSNINIKITQKMFDALVSIAYNTGVSGLRKSPVVDKIKKGKYEQAGKSILTFKISDKFPGLSKRRKKESKMFLTSL